MYTADGTALHGLHLNLKLPLRCVEGEGDYEGEGDFVPSMTVCLGARLSRVSVHASVLLPRRCMPTQSLLACLDAFVI